MKKLQLGKINSHELADWFGYGYNYFKSKKKNQVMPFLKDYCDYEVVHGGVIVKEIYIDEYEGDLSQDVRVYLEEVKRHPLNSISNIANSICGNPQYSHLSESQRKRRMSEAGKKGFGITADELSRGIFGNRKYCWAIKLQHETKPYRYLTIEEQTLFRQYISDIFGKNPKILEDMAILEKEFETSKMTKEEYLKHNARLAFKEGFSSVLYNFKQTTGLTLVRATRHEIEYGICGEEEKD